MPCALGDVHVREASVGPAEAEAAVELAHRREPVDPSAVRFDGRRRRVRGHDAVEVVRVLSGEVLVEERFVRLVHGPSRVEIARRSNGAPSAHARRRPR
jgi:hypothetical protein